MVSINSKQKVTRVVAISHLFIALGIFIILMVNVTRYGEHQFLGSGVTAFFLIRITGILGLFVGYFNFSSRFFSQRLKIAHLSLSIMSATLCGLFFVIFPSSFIDNYVSPFPAFVIQVILFFFEFFLGVFTATNSCWLQKSISNGAVIYGTVVDL